jgi:hypothetical protein
VTSAFTVVFPKDDSLISTGWRLRPTRGVSGTCLGMKTGLPAANVKNANSWKKRRKDILKNVNGGKKGRKELNERFDQGEGYTWGQYQSIYPVLSALGQQMNS